MSNANVSFTLTASDKTQAAFASVGNGLGQLKSKSDTLFSAFSGGVAGGLATGLLGAGFTTAIKGAIDDLDKLNDASERLGISVEDLSALNFAGKMNGLEFDDMTTALTKLSVKMQEAAAGSKEAGALFSDIGVKVTDSSGKLKSADSVFAEIADRFATFEDGAGKTALAVDAFGKSGAKLVPILNGGADGLKKMREEATSLGGIIDGKLAKQAADFNDNMDKLSVLAGSAGKSIAGGLLPWLNKTAEAFLVAQKHSDGFFDSLRLKIPGLQNVDAVGELSKVMAELEQIDYRLSNGRSKNVAEDEKQLAGLEKKAAYYRELANLQKKSGDPEKADVEKSGGATPIRRTQTGDGKAKKTAKEISEASAEATAYGKAMEALAKLTNDADAAQLDLTKSQKTLYDLMASAEWSNMPDAWKQTAVAQFEAAYAAEQAADSTKRLNDMLGETESAGIEKARSDMLLLVAALEKGTISEQQYTEAASARLNLKGNEDAKAAVNELDEFTKSAARNMQSSLADFIFDPFANGTKDMATQFGQMLQRMAAEAAAAQIMKNLFGSQGSTANGGSGDWGWVGQLAGLFSGMSFDGGGYTGAGSRSGGVDGKGGFPAILHPDESVIDHTKMLPRAGQSGNTTINQTIYAGQGTDAAQVRRSAAAGARSALGAITGAQRYA